MLRYDSIIERFQMELTWSISGWLPQLLNFNFFQFKMDEKLQDKELSARKIIFPANLLGFQFHIKISVYSNRTRKKLLSISTALIKSKNIFGTRRGNNYK